MFTAGVVVTTAINRWAPRAVLAISIVLTIAGLAILLASAWLSTPSLALFLTGGAVIGAGGSAMFKGSLSVVIGISPPAKLAESLAAFFLSGYTGISVPVIGVGIALQYINTRDALLGFAVIIRIGILAAGPALLTYKPQSGAPTTKN